MVDKKYERIEVTFNKDNEDEMKIYEYLNKKAKIVGKAKYIKQLLLDQLEREVE